MEPSSPLLCFLVVILMYKRCTISLSLDVVVVVVVVIFVVVVHIVIVLGFVHFFVINVIVVDFAF